MLLAACLAMVIGAAGARAAIEGQVRKSAPPWLSLFGVAIRSDGSIFVVGSKAALLVSTDHGATWTQQTMKERPGSVLFQDRDLYSIRFTPDGQSGWISGEDGIILHTADGGRTWTKQESGTTSNLFKVCAVDDQNAVIVGADGIILHTSDAGKTWEKIKSPKTITLFDVAFTDKNTGWIAGEFSTILKSTDGGKTWNIVYGGNTGDFTIGPFFTITFTDPEHGVAAGLAGDIVVTADGGKTWKPEKLPDAVGGYVALQDPTSKELWIGGSGGRLFYQEPDGQWKETTRATFQDLTDVAFIGNQGVAVGLNGTILLTKDAGKQWQAAQ